MKYSIVKNILYTIYIFKGFIIPYVYSNVVKNEDELLQILQKNENEITLDIKSKIDITHTISISQTIKKITINGYSSDVSVLYFQDSSHPLFFGENIKEISINNISIFGNIYFDNNEKIEINSLSLTGNIDSNFERHNNEYIRIFNMTYSSSEFSAENCINLEGGNTEINKSTFRGSKSCQNRLINFNGLERYKLSIIDCYFSGEYQCPFLNLDNGLMVNIENSTFEKAYSNELLGGGGVIRAFNSYVYIDDCILRDNVSMEEGGAFYLNDILDFNANKLEIYNTTSMHIGSVAYMKTSENIKSVARFTNIKQYNTGLKGMKLGGLIMNLEKSANVEIENYYAENLINPDSAGCAFIISDYVTLTIRNMEINKIRGRNIDGLFLFTYQAADVVFDIYNVTVNDLYQMNERETAAFLWVDDITSGSLEKIKVTNAGGNNSRFMFFGGKSQINIKDLEIENFYSRTSMEFIGYEATSASSLNFDGLKINNVTSQGVLFKYQGSESSIINSEIRNIHRCNVNQDCSNSDDRLYRRQYNELFILDGNTVLTINNTLFENIYGKNGIAVQNTNDINFYNDTFKDCYFQNGLIKLDRNTDYLIGKYNFYNTNFINIESEYGSILYIIDMLNSTSTHAYFENSKFINNTALKYGGVLYSISENVNDENIRFMDCEFIDNKAMIGNIAYSYDKKSEPYITNIDELKEIPNNFATNPTSIKFYEDFINGISLYSGQTIPEGISCGIYDDYNNVVTFNTDTSKIQYDEFMFFNIQVNDTYNAELIGSSNSYCWGDKCVFPSLKVIGNPGVYSLTLKINTFGHFSKFTNNTIDFFVKIKECNDSYIYQNMESQKHKSCYEPICEPSCSHGKCINTNLCNCTNTFFTGTYCNERFKYERIKWLDDTAKFFCTMFIFLTIMITAMTIIYRNNPLIKGGSIDFLILILIGSIINCIYIITITLEKTKSICYTNFILYNTGFSLVFGSIVIKSYRVYKIFHIRKNTFYKLEKKYMYGFLIILNFYHIMMSVFWRINDSVKLNETLTRDYKQYYSCSYPKIRILSIMINFSILFIGSYLAYSIRNVNEEFKENLVVPLYVYVVFTLIKEFLYIDLNIQEFFSIIGTLLNTFVVLYYLYMTKFYTIYFRNSLNNKSKSKSKQLNVIKI